MRLLPFANQSADGLWVSASFLHVPHADADSTLREFHRVLKPAGAMYLGVKGGAGERFGNPLDGLPRYFVYWTEAERDRKLHGGRARTIVTGLHGDHHGRWTHAHSDGAPLSGDHRGESRQCRHGLGTHRRNGRSPLALGGIRGAQLRRR